MFLVCLVFFVTDILYEGYNRHPMADITVRVWYDKASVIAIMDKLPRSLGRLELESD